jgi:hypothetical protein
MRRNACYGYWGLAVWTGLVLGLGRSAACRDAEGWTDTRTIGPIVCHANFSLGNLEGLVQELAELQNDLVRYLAVQPANQTIELYLFRDESSYQAYVSRYLPQVPYRRALYVKIGDRGMVFAFQSHDFEVDLRHECTHAFLHASLPMVPLWLDEGLAEYFEVAAVDRPFHSPHLFSVRWLSQFGLISRLENLEKKTDLNQMGNSEYRACWAWVHFMLHGPYVAHDELVRFLGDIQNRAPPGLLSQRLAQRVPDLQRRFSAHFQSWKH